MSHELSNWEAVIEWDDLASTMAMNCPFISRDTSPTARRCVNYWQSKLQVETVVASPISTQPRYVMRCEKRISFGGFHALKAALSEDMISFQYLESFAATLKTTSIPRQWSQR